MSRFRFRYQVGACAPRGTGDPSLVRAVFAVLVVATVAAFFATQQLKGEFPLVIRFATKPAHFSPNGDDYRDTTGVGFDLSEPASLSFMVVDSEGNEVRRLVSERRLAGDAKHRFRWDGRDDDGNPVSGRDLPDARRAARREPRDRLGQGDHRGPQAAAGHAAVREAVGGGHRPARRDAERAAALPRPEEQGAGDPRLPHGRREAAHRAPLPGRPEPDGRLGRPGEQRPAADRARAGGRLRVHGRRARPRGQPDRGAAAGAAAPPSRGRAPASRCAASRCAGRCRPSRPAPSPTSRSGRWTAASTGSCPASGTPSRCCTAAAWAGASASGSRARPGPASTSSACGRGSSAPSGRSPWPGCRPSAPAARRARWWCCPRSPGRA